MTSALVPFDMYSWQSFMDPALCHQCAQTFLHVTSMKLYHAHIVIKLAHDYACKPNRKGIF